MKKIVLSSWLCIFFAFVLLSCSNSEEKQVNKEYLDSQQYSTFKKDASEEIQRNADSDLSIEAQLRKLSRCSDENQLSLPLSINADSIVKLAENVSTECEIDLKARNFVLLGRSRIYNHTIRWVLLDRQTAYRDQELLATAFRDDELKSFRTVGIYKKNPSENIMTEVRVQNSGNSLRIRSQTNRKVFYPIEQENTTITEYEIDATGGIREL